MHVLGLVWLGTATHQFDESVSFFRDVMRLTVVVDQPDFVALQLPDTSLVEVFAPTSPYARHHESGPVAGFLVDDVEAARAELMAAGVELIGEIEVSDDYRWQYFRAPDGNLYEITSGPYRR
jgi:catechol 2,3-dioxygenase-like lactoylglutathione lyase family enzyme